MPVGAAALADPFPEVEDVGIGAHLLGQGVADRVEPTLHDGLGGLVGSLAVAWGGGYLGIDGLGPHPRRGRGRLGPGRLAREVGRLLDLAFDIVVDCLQFRRAGDARRLQSLAQSQDRAALEPRVDLFLGAVGADQRIALVVPDDAIGERFDQRRPTAAAGPLDGLLHHPPHRDHVVAVDLDAGDAVGGGLAGDVGVAGGHREGGGRGVEIVLADEDHRHVLDTGKIDPFVERAVVDRPIAEEGHAYRVGATQPGTDATADGGGNAGGHNAVGAQEAVGGGVQVHRAAATAAAAGGLAG